jgi:hypothetical protein
MVRLKRSALPLVCGRVAASEAALRDEIAQGLAPGVAAAVGQGDSLDPGDSQPCEVFGGAGAGLLAGVDFGVGEPGVVVNLFVADAGAAPGAAAFEAGTAVGALSAAFAEPADLFDVDLDEFAGPFALVAD